MLERLLDELTRLGGGVPPPALGELQAHHRADELLLGAVVQVAAKPAAFLIARLDDPGTRGGQLLARVNVGERGRDKLREVGEPVLRAFRKGADVPARGDDAPPMSCRQR
jgi:hypothetical protein